MPDQDKVAVLKQQLHTAEKACAAWHAAGNQERYMESYVLTEAIELQLIRLLEAARSDPGGAVKPSEFSAGAAPRAHRHAVTERVDSITQSIVDQGIVLFAQGSIREALQFFRCHQVPEDLVTRVVRNPDERRRYINDFVTGN